MSEIPCLKEKTQSASGESQVKTYLISDLISQDFNQRNGDQIKMEQPQIEVDSEI